MLRLFMSACIAATGIGAAVTATPAKADRIQDISYDEGKIVHYRDRTSLPTHQARICLRNRTGQPKRVLWRQIRSANPITMLVNKGQQSCVTMPKDQRVSFDFQDRSVSVTTFSMDMSGLGGTVTLFDWVADGPLPTTCGGIGEKPCSLFNRIPSCDPGLYEVFLTSCEARKPELAEIMEANQDYQRQLNSLSDCLNTDVRRRQIRAAVDAEDAALARQATSPCLTDSVMSRLSQPRPDGEHYRTLSIGVSTSVQAGFGAGGEVGLVFSLEGEDRSIHDLVRFYASGDVNDFGAALGVGVDMVVGLSKDPLQTGTSHKWSVNFAGIFGIGGGVAYVFDYSELSSQPNIALASTRDLNGIAVFGGVGIGIDGGSIHRTRTEIFGPPVRQQVGGHLKSLASNLCLDIWGVIAKVSTCKPVSTNKFQGWTLSNGFIRGPEGKCLDVAENRNFGTVTVAPCRAPGSRVFQEWVRQGQQIRNVLSRRCLEASGNRSGSNVVIADCVSTSPNQRWE